MQEKHNTTISTQTLNWLKKIKHVALDMDGTIYLDNNLFPYTKKFLNQLDNLNISYSFLTNNPTKSIEDYIKKLKNLGIEAKEENMYTSALAVIDYLRETYPEKKKLYIVGTDSMIQQFRQAGFRICQDDSSDSPEALILAFDTSLTYEKLCRAAWWAAKGIPYIASNPDKVCPTQEETILVDCGSIQKCIEEATNRCPDKVLGKPDPQMLRGIMSRHNLKAEQIAMVGDRIYTDIAMANAAGALSVLVLSGESSLEDALKVEEEAKTQASPKFTPANLIAANISELGDLLEESHKSQEVAG